MWLSWRQFRGQAIVAAAALALVLVAVVITRPRLTDLYDKTVAPCAPPADCPQVVGEFLGHPMIQALGIVVLFAPGLVGMFWGAPLVARELESGTFRLAWTQSITRSRWLAVKLLVVGLSSVAATGLLSLMVTWGSSPIDTVSADQFSPLVFSERGIVPMGYAAFAFVLGVTAGLLIRRTLAAMATTMVVFLTIRIAVTEWIRPHFLNPVQDAVALDPQSTGYGGFGTGSATLQSFGQGGDTLWPGELNLPDAWISFTGILDKQGAALTPEYVAQTCPLLGPAATHLNIAGGSQAAADAFAVLQECVIKVGATFREVVIYQPADRYWLFQGLETGLFVCLAIALAGISFWWIRRRLT